MGRIVRNGLDYSGISVNADGVFIDTDNIIIAETYENDQTIPNYTATEDCFIRIYVMGKGQQTTTININSKMVANCYFTASDGSQTVLLYLKKGQVLSISSGGYWNVNYTVYGIQSGSSSSGGGGGGGSTVSWSQIQQTGIRIATINIDGNSTDVYAPEGGEVDWTDVTGTLTVGQTEITLTDNSINSNSTFEFFTDKYGVSPLEVTLLTEPERVLLQPLVTQSSDLSVTVTAHDSLNSSHVPWMAFHEDVDTASWIGGYARDPKFYHWLLVEFPTATSFKEFYFTTNDGNRTHAPTGVQYSNDGSTFTDCTISSSTTSGYDVSCILSEQYTAKYLKIFIYGGWGTSAYPQIGELKIYGYTEPGHSIKLRFKKQTSNLGVKVRVTNND